MSRILLLTFRISFLKCKVSGMLCVQALTITEKTVIYSHIFKIYTKQSLAVI